MPSNIGNLGIYLFILIGLILGLVLDCLLRFENTTLFYYMFFTLFALLYGLAYNEKNPLRLVGTSFIVALFLSLPLIPFNPDHAPKLFGHMITFICAFPIFVYATHSFHYAYHHDNTWRVTYASLFAAVWNTIVLLFVASVFLGLSDLLILLAAFIFKTLGYDYLWNLYFHNYHFRLITKTTLFFIGLGIGQQNIKIIYSLRFLLLRMMFFLFPFLALISGLYFILYLIHLFAQGPAESFNPLNILIPITIFGIIFFNAYYQDGQQEANVPSWLKISLRVYRVILLILVLMMTYQLFQKNSLDSNIIICLITVILYSLTYAVTAFFSESLERKWIQLGNISCALFFIVLLFLFNLPYMSFAFDVGSQPPLVTSMNQVN